MRWKLLSGLFLIAELTLCACGKVAGICNTSSRAIQNREQNTEPAETEASAALQIPSSADEKNNMPNTAEIPDDENTIVAQIS